MANPRQPQDPFEAAGRILTANGGLIGDRFNSGLANGYSVNGQPTVSGLGTRQSRVPNYRTAVTKRSVVKWLVPEQPMIEMYVNPENITYSYKKEINKQRTKGGFALQYWGEDLATLRISGTTGTSGIEGINILYDIYRNEQLMFDPYALALAAESDRLRQQELSEDIFGLGGLNGNAANLGTSIISGVLLGAAGNVANSVGNSLGRALGSVESSVVGGNPTATRNKPTPASLAFTVEMYWSGEVYRGYFTDFVVDERSEVLGMFTYTMNFVVTQKRGYRQNYLGWHRSPSTGQSNSNPNYGTAYSYGGLVTDGGIVPTPNRVDQPNLNSPFVDPGQNGLNLIPGVTNEFLNSILDPFDVG